MGRVISIICLKIRSDSLITSLYQVLLPIIKLYLLVFQSEKLLIQKVYHMQMDCAKKFFPYFGKM